MQLVDVLKKLRELEQTNESVKDAIDSAKRMNGENNLTEAQRLYSVKLENDKGVTKNVRVKAGSEQEAKDNATMDPKFKAVSARVVDAPADDEEDDDLEESFEQDVAEAEMDEMVKVMRTNPVTGDFERYERGATAPGAQAHRDKTAAAMKDFRKQTGIAGAKDLQGDYRAKQAGLNIHANTPLKAEPYVEEDDVEEGNKFTGNLAKARAAGKKEADLDGDGDMEKVQESVDLTECGMMPENMGMMHNTPATITMTATAGSGSEVSSMLKDILTLAGQRSHADAYVMDGGCSMEEDGGFADATSGPNEFEAGVEQQLQQGDDMHKPHEQHAGMAKLGDNPMASEDVEELAESLWAQFKASK